MRNGKQQITVKEVNEGKLQRLYYLAGRYITQSITYHELEEISQITAEEDDDEAYSQTFVILTSTNYLARFFQGMGISVVLPELSNK